MLAITAFHTDNCEFMRLHVPHTWLQCLPLPPSQAVTAVSGTRTSTASPMTALNASCHSETSIKISITVNLAGSKQNV
jgi:hypothetical protein